MTLQLRSNVFYCLANGKVVLLDLAADRYIGLPEAAQCAFLKLTQAIPLTSEELTALGTLQKAGLVVDRGGRSPNSAQFVPPVHSTLYSSAPRPGILSLFRAWTAQRHAVHTLHRQGLLAAIKRVEARKRASAGTGRTLDDHVPQSALSAFLRLRRYVMTDDQCLRRSLGLIEYLAGVGFFPTLVIGVRMKPFEAHAWVQWHDTVLNDTVDQVSRYTPILTV